MSADQVSERAVALVSAARTAGAAWAALPVDERARRLTVASKDLLAGADELANLVAAETHKPLGEAYSSDVLGVADLFGYWCSQGPQHLARRKARIPALDMPGKTGWIEREARGVIAVISPWNYPVALPMRVIVPALLAGNAVVFKPSEFTPRSGAWLVNKLRAHLGDVIAVLEGDGAAGAALIEARPDLIHFTGSTVTGRKVAVRGAELGIPVESELGGKDCAVVLDDALLDRTAAGVAWGIVHNAGQDCASVERVVVHARVADRFVPLLVEKLNATASQVPHLVTATQRQIVIAHIEDALAQGGTLLCGGVPADDATPIPPTLITGIPRSARAWAEESFGPIAVIETQHDDEALIAAANDTVYGLGGSVWGEDLTRAESVARRLRTGMVWVNNTAFTGAIPDMPWVGRGASGNGLTSSPEVLDHLTRPRVVLLDKSKSIEPWWYPYGDTLLDLMRNLIERQRVGGVMATVRTLGALNRRNKALSERS